jgi:hypothetical protein
MTAILRESYLLKTDRLTNKARKPNSRKFSKIILFIWIIGSKAVMFQGSSLTFWHGSFTFHSNKSPTWCNIFQFIILTFVYSSTCNGRPARPRTQHDCHHDTKVKPEVATAATELLMMGGKTPETCWAVNKPQDNKLKNVASGWWFIWIVRWCTDLQTLNYTFKF